MLLGLLREDRSLTRRLLPPGAAEKLREIVEERVVRKPSLSTSVDLPLSQSSKRILSRAAQEADDLKHPAIGTGHLVLALLQEKSCLAADILLQQGLDYPKTVEFVRDFEFYEERQSQVLYRPYMGAPHRRPAPPGTTVRIHDTAHDLEFIRAGVRWCRGVLWHWAKKAWHPQDIVVQRSDGRISFDLSLAEDTAHFQLVENGWNHDLCTVCGWQLYASPEQEHSTGYTNGRVWVCVECFDKFLQGRDYFSTSHPEIT